MAQSKTLVSFDKENLLKEKEKRGKKREKKKGKKVLSIRVLSLEMQVHLKLLVKKRNKRQKL
jgi:hypothetical protein